MAAKPIPEGFSTVTPYLVIKDSRKFIDFLKNAFGATEHSLNNAPNGKIMHAEIKVGNSMIMMSEANEQFPASGGKFYMYVPDTDSTYKKAIDAGATSTMEPADQFYGDRTAGVTDSFGNTWWIGTHIEDVPAEEIKRRMEESMKKK